MLPNLFTNAQALEAVRTIRPMLPQLLGAEAAQQVDLQIDELLNQPDLDENTKVDHLIEVLDQHPDAQTWLDDFLEQNKIPNEIPKVIPNVAGDGSAQARTHKYQCPECHATYAELPQSRVPKCSAHPDKTLTPI